MILNSLNDINFNTFQVSASDADTGANGDIVYSIQSVSNNGFSKFSIQNDAGTGRATISCVGSVTDGEVYVLTVQATDQGQPISERRYIYIYTVKPHYLQLDGT